MGLATFAPGRNGEAPLIAVGASWGQRLGHHLVGGRFDPIEIPRNVSSDSKLFYTGGSLYLAIGNGVTKYRP